MFQRHYAKHYELFNLDKPYKKEIQFVYKWADKPKWIFDIGCGAAHYWKYYPDTVHIFGVDKSMDMVRRAESQGSIICADIKEYAHQHQGKFECATALFDVMNYIDEHNWWRELPLEKGGFFIFDIWDKEKVSEDGFRETQKGVGKLTRTIRPLAVDGDSVELELMVDDDGVIIKERHKMYLHSHQDIEKFSEPDFKIEAVKKTKSWQTWYKLKRQ